MSIKVNFHASFSRTLFIDLNNAGRRSIVESTHFTAHRSKSLVYLAISLSDGFWGTLSLMVSLQSITQRWRRFCVRSSSDWTNLKNKKKILLISGCSNFALDLLNSCWIFRISTGYLKDQLDLQKINWIFKIFTGSY